MRIADLERLSFFHASEASFNLELSIDLTVLISILDKTVVLGHGERLLLFGIVTLLICCGVCDSLSTFFSSSCDLLSLSGLLLKGLLGSNLNCVWF